MVEGILRSPQVETSDAGISRSDLPSLYQVASQVSQSGQKAYKGWILANLVLVVLAALLSAVLEWVPQDLEKALAVAIAAVLVSAMMTKIFNHETQGAQNWFDGRAVAESVKTNAWRYMMGVPPFQDDRGVNELFAHRMSAIQMDYRGLSQDLMVVEDDMHQISPLMRRIREKEWGSRRGAYLQHRLDGQISWYRTKSTIARKASRRWGWASIVAELVGVLLALSIFFLPMSTLVGLVGVVASLAAGFQAWTQLGRHAELSRSYAMACQELVAIRDLMKSARTEEEFVRSVEFSEEAISREHTMWVAKRTT